MSCLSDLHLALAKAVLVSFPFLRLDQEMSIEVSPCIIDLSLCLCLGLTRRFQLEHAFYFEPYTLPELMQLVLQRCQKKEVGLPLVIRSKVEDLIGSKMKAANWGNAGSVERIIDRAIDKASQRSLKTKSALLELADFADSDSNPAETLVRPHCSCLFEPLGVGRSPRSKAAAHDSSLCPSLDLTWCCSALSSLPNPILSRRTRWSRSARFTTWAWSGKRLQR